MKFFKYKIYHSPSNIYIFQAIQESLAKQIPDEPPENSDKPVCKLRIRTPTREIIERRFYANNVLGVVLNYITSKGFHISEHKLLTTFPRRDVSISPHLSIFLLHAKFSGNGI